MALFGSKKEKKTVKITDIFSPEEIKEISDVISPKLKSGEYMALPQMMAKGMMDYLSRPDKEYSYNNFDDNGNRKIPYGELKGLINNEKI